MSDDKGTNSVSPRNEGTSTEQPQREELLRARNYLDLVEIIFVGLDSEGFIVFANRKCCEVLGYDYDEAIGKDWFKTFLPKKVRKETHDVFRSLMKGKTEPVEYFENPILTKDGEERIIAWHNTLLTDEAGSITGTLSSGEDITELKEAEEQIRVSEEKHKRLFETSQDGIAYADLNGLYIDVNQGFLNIVGYDREELLSKTYLDITPEKWASAEAEIDKTQVRVRGYSDEYEKEYICKDGTVVPVSIRTWLTKDDEDRPLHTIAIVRDITERKRAEEALRESEEKYRTILQSMHDLVFVIDKHDCYSQHYTSSEELLIASPKEFIGRHIGEVLPPSEAKRFLESFQRVRETGNSEAFDYQLEIGGQKHWFWAVLSLHEDGEGIVQVVRDITRRKKSEKSLQESEQRYKELIDMLPQGVVAADLNENMDLVNKEMCNILGYGFEELIGRSLLDFVDERDAKKMTTQTARRTQGVFSSYDLRMIHKTGEVRDVQVSAAPVRNDTGEIDRAIGVFVDITESKQNEEERRQQHSELEVYAALIRHDLRNDLGIILGNVDFAKMIVGKNDSEILKTLSSTEAACERMVNLLKAVSRPVDSIEKNIVALVRLVSAQAQDAHAKLTVNDDAEELTIAGNRLFPMVFENLLRNAAAHAGEKPIVDMIISKEGTNVQVIVTDNGPGIPEEVRNHLFHRGASTSGGGLGLYLSKEIVNAMNGSIELMDTDPGEGATFRILLPLTM